ncbi:Protein CBG26889 [Caenorhabditis briggsae]|uniref:Uncharacterized protein n=2 Tax=Caenorhabditis briggsae TaxID=6238 RepID=A0AAE8ZYN0_CAEBR|nr:Protein CBG26889 [Caenorhabditis briggsae]ULT86108.1 hypothetical protein L3Y34_006057 [Caenorhabditis briggsae]CAR99619.1 Protein CBG26889 [Caenorhabditis briggsae]
MNLVFNTLLITGLIACCEAACNTCACTGHPDLFTKELVAGFEQTVMNLTFIENDQATSLEALVCVGGSTWQAHTPRFTEVKNIGCYGAKNNLPF